MQPRASSAGKYVCKGKGIMGRTVTVTVPPLGLVPPVVVTVPVAKTVPLGAVGFGATAVVSVAVLGTTVTVVGGEVPGPTVLVGDGT